MFIEHGKAKYTYSAAFLDSKWNQLVFESLLNKVDAVIIARLRRGCLQIMSSLCTVTFAAVTGSCFTAKAAAYRWTFLVH